MSEYLNKTEKQILLAAIKTVIRSTTHHRLGHYNVVEVDVNTFRVYEGLETTRLVHSLEAITVAEVVSIDVSVYVILDETRVICLEFTID
jgi:hypothetical protein